MANIIRMPYSNTASNTPSSLANGQLGINQADGKLYYRNSSGVVTQLATGGGGGGSAELVYTYANTSDFPAVGSTSLLYCATDVGKIFRYTGSVYAEVGPIGGTMPWKSAPASSSASGNPGDVAYDSSYLYCCVSSGLWKATPITRWDGDPYWTNTVFLMRFDGANGSTTFTDLSATGVTATSSGGAAVSTTQAKFGQSLSLNGSSGFLTLGNYGSALTFSGDYTVEAWVYITSTGTYHAIFDGRSPGGFADYTFGMYNVNGTLRLDHVTATGRITGSTTSVALNTWTHVAWVRKSGTIRCFVNGVRDDATFSNSNTLTPLGTVYLGKVIDPFYVAGYIDEVRVTKAARYDAVSFSVPTAQFPAFAS